MEITPKPIHDYCVKGSSPGAEIFDEITKLTLERFPNVAHMMVGRLEGAFLSLVAKLSGANRILELGTFTGYSSTAFALGLPADGKITTLDRDPVATSIAKTFWEKTGVAERVELILGDARSNIKTLIGEIEDRTRMPYDLVFIDVDKANYLFYFESALKLLKPHGLILIDNVLWSGYVLHPEDESDRTMIVFNETIQKDPRVELVMLPIRDGITLARKR